MQSENLRKLSSDDLSACVTAGTPVVYIRFGVRYEGIVERERKRSNQTEFYFVGNRMRKEEELRIWETPVNLYARVPMKLDFGHIVQAAFGGPAKGGSGFMD